MTHGAPGHKRRKRKENPYGSFIMLKRSVSLLLANNELTLTDFGAYIAFLLHATWYYEDPNTRYPRSYAKMAEIAGGDRTKWYKYRERFKKIGLIETDEFGDDVLPYFFTEEAEPQHSVDESPHLSANEQSDVAKSQQPSNPFEILSGNDVRLIEANNGQIVAKSQHKAADVDTNKETLINTNLDSRLVTAKKGQQPVERKKCEKCRNLLQGTDILRAALKKQALCEACRNKLA